MEIVVIVVES